MTTGTVSAVRLDARRLRRFKGQITSSSPEIELQLFIALAQSLRVYLWDLFCTVGPTIFRL